MTDTPEAVRLADSMLECVDDSPWLTCNVAKMDVKAAAALLRCFPELEAERDQLRAELEKVRVPDVDHLAQFIRWANGGHKMGAGALAERIVEWLTSTPRRSERTVMSQEQTLEQALSAIEGLMAGAELDSDGAWGRIVMPSGKAMDAGKAAADAMRAALSATQPAQAAQGEPIGYQAIFNAIAAATKATSKGSSPVAIDVSVEAFTKCIGPIYTTPQPAAQGEPDEQARFEAGCVVMQYLRDSGAPHRAVHHMLIALHGDPEKKQPAPPAAAQGAGEVVAEYAKSAALDALIAAAPLLYRAGHNAESAECNKAVLFLTGHAAPAGAPTQPAAGADVLLDALRDNSWDLVCFERPTGGDDADIGWRVIEHHMAKPNERVIAEVFKDDPGAAIRAAIAASGRQE